MDAEACGRTAEHEKHLWMAPGRKMAVCPGVGQQHAAPTGQDLPAEQQLANAMDAVRRETAALRSQLATCTCTASIADYEGPDPECPVHGAIRAFNIASAILNDVPRKLGEILAAREIVGPEGQREQILIEMTQWLREEAGQL